MKITACPKCGSRRIFQGRLKEGVLTGYTTKYVCRDCGYRGFPFIFDSEEEYYKFLEQLTKDKKDGTEKYIPEEIEEPKKSLILKNMTTKLGLSLLVAGILLTVATGGVFIFLTKLIIIDGAVLFIAGFLGPGEKELKNKIKNMKRYPYYAGLILIISGIIFTLLYILLLFFMFNLDLFLSLEDQIPFQIIQGYMIVLFLLQISFCLIAMIGGFFSILKRRWEIAILGGIIGTLILIPYYIGTILSLVALILISFSRPLFQSTKKF